MIPAQQPFDALYRQEIVRADGKPHVYHDRKPVVAWSDDGFPLVVGKERLTRADKWSNFDGIAPQESPVVAVLPGGGWMVEWKGEDGSDSWSTPVLGWYVHADGEVTPFETDPEGVVSGDPTTNLAFVRLYHPDHPRPVLS